MIDHIISGANTNPACFITESKSLPSPQRPNPRRSIDKSTIPIFIAKRELPVKHSIPLLSMQIFGARAQKILIAGKTPALNCLQKAVYDSAPINSLASILSMSARSHHVIAKQTFPALFRRRFSPYVPKCGKS